MIQRAEKRAREKMYLQLIYCFYVYQSSQPLNGTLYFADHINVTASHTAERTVVNFAGLSDSTELVFPLFVFTVFLSLFFPSEIACDT